MMGLDEKNREVSKAWRLFPQVTMRGYYNPVSQTITLAEFERKHFDNFKKNNLYESKDFFKVYMHELTHWFDNLSTLWGQNHLINIYNALNAFANYDENYFWYIVKAKSEIQRSFHATYYTTLEEGAKLEWNGLPWIYQLSCGYEFLSNGRLNKNRPIVFTRFFNSDKLYVCRVPFSVSSLTETNATFVEQDTELKFISSLKETDKMIENRIITDNYKKQIYDSSLAVYSVGAHYLANQLKIKDIIEAYKLASSLSIFTLNLPDELFDKIIIPKEFEEWGDKNQSLIKNKDRGYAYIAICKQSAVYSDTMSIKEWLNSTLSNVGLPDVEEINKITLQDMDNLKANIIEGPYTDTINYLLEIGKHNFKIKGNYQNILADNFYNNKDVIYPPIVLGDGSILIIGDKCKVDQMKYNIEKLTETSWKFHKFSESFLEVCHD